MAPLSPAAAQHRARIAALARTKPADDPELVEEKKAFWTQRIEDYVRDTLEKAPPLSDEQRSRLAELLRPVRGGA